MHFNLVWSFIQSLGKHSAIIASFKPLHPITYCWFEVTPSTLAGFEWESQITVTSDSSHPADNTPLFDSVWLILFSDIRSPIPGNTEALFPSKESSLWMETYVSFFPLSQGLSVWQRKETDIRVLAALSLFAKKTSAAASLVINS